MKKLLETAQKNLDAACKGAEDVCSIRYWAGYKQAVLDAAKKLREEGLDELEDE